MTNLIDMLDALDTALSTDEELAIQKPLFEVFSGDCPAPDWNSIVQKCDEVLASLDSSILIGDSPLF
jgi:hypothetical protein